KLRQLQYRSYVYELTLYHYNYELLPLRRFETQLSRKTHGYITRLVSDDPFKSFTVPEGDEIPPYCYEVAFFPNAFQNRGCALGFRVPGSMLGSRGDQSKGKIDWLCFDRTVQEHIEKWVAEVPVDKEGLGVLGSKIRLFEAVATLDKAPLVKKGTVQGHKEHREWYMALERAKYPIVKLKLTWKNKGRDWLNDIDAQKQAEMDKNRKEGEEMDEDEEGDVD
ncbi:hypothetical protein K458DRAFT_248553, partial [Lentithecium fluviatile CBS 122367]